MAWLFVLAMFASKWEYSVNGVNNDLGTRREDFVGDTLCNSTINISPGDKGSLFNYEGGGENCSYHLQAPDGYVVELTVGMVTFGAETCSDKWLLVRDGASSQTHSVWEICSEYAESANEMWRGRNMFIEFANKVGSEGKWFQLDYTAMVDNLLPLHSATTTETPVGGYNDCSDRLLKTDEDSELPNTAPEVQSNYVPTYRVTFKHEHRCVGQSQCEVKLCDNGGNCVKNGHKETCHCLKGYSGEFCREGGSGNLEFEQRPQNRTVKRQNQAVALCLVKYPRNGGIVVYSWMFKGERIPEYRASTGYGDRGNGVLEIKKFSEQNEGQYTCLARAGNLTAEHVFSMTMVNDCNLDGFRGPTNEEGIVGNTVFLTCSVRNAKDVHWKKDGQVIDFEVNTRMKHLSNHYLLISNLDMEDEGDYSCEATDFENCHSFTTGHLRVFQLGYHSKYCGRSLHDQIRENMVTPYISKGDDANLKEHPWHVTMLQYSRNGKLEPFCGATVISLNYLITAAHCIASFYKGKEEFKPENVKLSFASTRCFTSNTMKAFKRYIIHENFNKTAHFDSNIALIELEEPLEYSLSIRPVCLEDATYINRRFFENRRTNISPGRVVGCGQLSSNHYRGLPDKLQTLYMPYVNNEDCVYNIDQAGKHLQLTNNTFCAGRLKRGVGDVCPGDSGGGMLMEAHGEFRWVLTGIMSFRMRGCDNSNSYSMFTNVGNFYEWINYHTHFTEEQVDMSFLDEFKIYLPQQISALK